MHTIQTITKTAYVYYSNILERIKITTVNSACFYIQGCYANHQNPTEMNIVFIRKHLV